MQQSEQVVASQHLCATECTIKALIIEPDDILWQPSAEAALENFLFFCPLLKKLKPDQFINDYLNQFFDMLGKEFGTGTAYYRNRKLPELWSRYLCDKITSKEALNLAQQAVAKHTWFYNQPILSVAAEKAFDPQQEAESMQLIQDMFDLLRELKEQGYILILFSNKSTASTRALERRFELSNLFDVNLTSGIMHSLKPDADTYQKLVDALLGMGLKPEQCLCLENHEVYAQPLRELHMRVQVLNSPQRLTKEEFRKALKKNGVLFIEEVA